MAFDMTLNTNNSYGATNPSNMAAWQQPIGFYCDDGTIDTLPVAFLTEFYSTGDLPTIDLANTCSTVDDPLFPGTNLPNCTFLAAGIETCQKAGKIVTLSIGGATGGVGFTSDSEGQAYAQVIWDIFLGGNSTTRPFGTAVLDGIDMDIEGGSQTGYTAFLTALRTLMTNGGNKRYYITAAPQCPFPDAYIGTTLNEFGFDAVYVQFYNNYCELSNYGNSNDWDFGMWDNWAKTVSPNPDVKVYIGALASTAAGSGYVSTSTLGTIVSQTRSRYSSFGGVMLWDASQAYANGRYDQAVKAALTRSTWPAPSESSSSSSATTSSAKAASTAAVKKTTVATSNAVPTTSAGAGCAGISPWASNLIYLGGDQVMYANQLWTAKWWTEESTPGGSDGVWTLVGPCS
ncbi:glycoside hydrolase family 18 protein [Boletus coccyginus]|nr:glycoside hydrolase family 18 protein [Boletus coccyginus]